MIMLTPRLLVVLLAAAGAHSQVLYSRKSFELQVCCVQVLYYRKSFEQCCFVKISAKSTQKQCFGVACFRLGNNIGDQKVNTYVNNVTIT